RSRLLEELGCGEMLALATLQGRVDHESPQLPTRVLKRRLGRLHGRTGARGRGAAEQQRTNAIHAVALGRRPAVQYQSADTVRAIALDRWLVQHQRTDAVCSAALDSPSVVQHQRTSPVRVSPVRAVACKRGSAVAAISTVATVALRWAKIPD